MESFEDDIMKKSTMAATRRRKIYTGRLLSTPASLLLFTLLSHDALAFHSCLGPGAAKRTALNVQLSSRQLQFWEDVEDGLVDVEKFYESRGQSMHRIRTFCER